MKEKIIEKEKVKELDSTENASEFKNEKIPPSPFAKNHLDFYTIDEVAKVLESHKVRGGFAFEDGSGPIYYE